jgi:hypothetical protein
MSHAGHKYQDFVAGSLFCLTGLATLAGSSSYPMGTTMRMGAGYFPQLLGGLLAALGAAVLTRALWQLIRAGKSEHPPLLAMLKTSLRALSFPVLRPVALVGVGVLAFAALLGSIGLAGATLLLVTISGAAHHESRLIELLVLGVGLSVFGIGVFVWGLGLPLPILPV